MNVPETFFSINEEVMLFLLSCVCGVFIGVGYDVFRTARIIFPHNTLAVVIEDVIFLAVYALFLSAFSSVFARGELRFYYTVGNSIGFTLYFFTLGSVVTATMRKIYSVMVSLVSAVLKPLKTVYVSLCKKIHGKTVENYENSVKSNKKSSFLLQNNNDLLYNKKENKKRKNVKNVAEKEKRKAKKQKPV